MKCGLDIPTAGAYANPAVLMELAVEAEQAGWDGFFLWDILFAENQPTQPVTNPWTALAAIAVRTQRIKIGAMLTPLPRRRPWQVARTTVALDHLSNGRVVFGAGLGYQSLDFLPFGEDYDVHARAQKLEEGLQVLTGLWSGDAFDFQGDYYHINVPAFLPGPLQSPRIPIWLAGGWPRRKPLRRAAQWDGIYLMYVNQETGELLTPAEVREAASYMHDQRTDNRPFDIAVCGTLPVESAQSKDVIRQHEQAGATWWFAYETDEQTFDDYRAYIQQGPPKI